MIETHATVVSIEGEFAIVEVKRDVGCGNCTGQNACATGLLSSIFHQKPQRLRVFNQPQAKLGEEVIIGIADGAVLKSALVMYIMPLLSLFLGALIGRFLAAGATNVDVYAGIGALAGLLAGALWARRFNKLNQSNARFQPVILPPRFHQLFKLIKEPK